MPWGRFGEDGIFVIFNNRKNQTFLMKMNTDFRNNRENLIFRKIGILKIWGSLFVH